MAAHPATAFRGSPRAWRSAAAAAVALVAAALGCAGDGDFPVVGTLERDRIELVAEASEPIREIAVREGEPVEAGDLILRLDDSRLRAQLERARSERNRAAARLAELERGPRQERIEEARARLAEAESALANARRELERTRELFEQGVVSEQRLDERGTVYREARARRDAARAALDERVSGTTSEEIAQARAALEAAEAAVTDARVRAERLEVRSPRRGLVDALPFEVGEQPPAGAVVAVLLADTSPYARVYVPEPLRAGVAPGVAARVQVDGVEGTLTGRVRTVSHEASFTPYFALTERDRSRLAYVAEIELTETRARELPTGLPLEAVFEPAPERSARLEIGS